MRKDHEEVCPLSRGMMLQSLSVPLQGGVRFVLNPVPAPPLADLAACCPRGERYGVPTFHLQKYVGLGACYGPGGVWVTKAHLTRVLPTSVTVLVKRNSHFRLFNLTTFSADSHVFTIPTI